MFSDKEFIELQSSLQDIYKIFSGYKKPSVNLTCLDYGPTKEEIEVFQKFELQELPYDFISKLEFYDETWGTWGTCEEVKYFIPRVFEYMALHWMNKEGNQYWFFNKSINYKLRRRDNWTQEEQHAIKVFTRSLFLCFINYGNFEFIDEVFDFIFSINDNIDSYLNILENTSDIIKETIFLAIFNNWLNTDVFGNRTKYQIYSMKIPLSFMDRKKIFLETILKKYDLILNLEFLYKEPWDYLILNGIYPISNLIKYIGKNSENINCVDINGQKVFIARIYSDCGKLIPGANYLAEFCFYYDDSVSFIETVELINEEKYGFEQMEDSVYGYYLYGKMDNNKLDLNGFFLENRLFSECNSLCGKFVKINIYMIDMEFPNCLYF